MSNGYGPAMRVFAKIYKVPFSPLIKLGHTSVAHVPDSYLQWDTFETCLQNVLDSIDILRELGFVII